MKTLKVILISALVIFPSFTWAASLYFSPESTKIGLDGELTLIVLLDSPEGVNALEGIISFPPNLLELKSISDGNSIISFWVEKPKANTAEPGKIIFSGVVPGGFFSTKGKVVSLTFLTKSEGKGEVRLGSVRGYKNDGEGTETPVDVSPGVVTVLGTREAKKPSQTSDTTPPEDFVPIVAQDGNIFENRWFVSFGTQDKGAGVAKYEVVETSERYKIKDGSLVGREEERKTLAWMESYSPYELKDQERGSYTYIRVTDNAGNSRVVRLSPQSSFMMVFVWVIIILILLYVAWHLFKRRQAQRNKLA